MKGEATTIGPAMLVRKARIVPSLVALFAVFVPMMHVALGENETGKVRLQDGYSVLKWPGDKNSVRVPLKYGAGWLFVQDIEINGHRIGPFLIMTGANVTVVDAEVANKLGLQTIGHGVIKADRDVSYTVAPVESLRVAELTLTNHVILEMDLDWLRKELGVQVVGVIGTDFLSKATFEVDFLKPELVFHRPGTFNPDKEMKEFPLEVLGLADGLGPYSAANRYAGQPAVWAEVDGATARCILDFGDHEAISLQSGFVKTHPHLLQEGRASGGLITRLGNWGKDYRANIRQVTLLGQQFRDLQRQHAFVRGQSSLADAVVGTGLLRNWRLALSLAEGKLWAKYEPATASKLLESGWQLNGRDLAGLTMVMDAAARGDRDAVVELLRRGADNSLKGPDGETILYYALRGGNVEVTQLMLDSKYVVDINATTGSGVTPLMIAVFYEPEAVTLLLRKGAKVDARSDIGATACYYAVLGGNADAVDALMEKKCALDTRNKEGWSLLCVAAAEGQFRIFRRLHEAGAPVDVDEPGRRTLLHFAARGGDPDIVRYILTLPKAPDIEARNVDGWTALMVAAEQGQRATGEALLAAGADVNASQEGTTALHIAAFHGYPELVNLFLKNGADPNGATRSKGITPLMAGVQGGNMEVVHDLLDAGALSNILDRRGKSALDFAVERKDQKMIELLRAAQQRKAVTLGVSARACGNSM